MLNRLPMSWQPVVVVLSLPVSHPCSARIGTAPQGEMEVVYAFGRKLLGINVIFF